MRESSKRERTREKTIRLDAQTLPPMSPSAIKVFFPTEAGMVGNRYHHPHRSLPKFPTLQSMGILKRGLFRSLSLGWFGINRGLIGTEDQRWERAAAASGRDAVVKAFIPVAPACCQFCS